MKTGKIVNVLAILLAFSLITSVSWADKLVIKGSTTVLPIAQKTVEAFMKENPEIKVSYSGGGSSNGIKALIDKTTDVANASRFIKAKEVKAAVEKGIYPIPFACAYDSIIPVVHPANNLKNISGEQLKKIYMGKIRNFKEIGGSDRPVVVISRDTSSGTFETWAKKIMKKERITPRASVMASNGAVIQAVSSNKNAIGYVGIGYLTESVKTLSVDGIPGTKETTLSGKYPVSRPLFMFTNGWPKGNTLKYINFVLNPKKGQNFVENSGYVRLY